MSEIELDMTGVLACEFCQAKAGEPCRTPRGKRANTHAPRILTWEPHFEDELLHLVTDAYYEFLDIRSQWGDDYIWRKHHAVTVAEWLQKVERLFPDLIK